MSLPEPFSLRDSTDDDLPALQALYAHHVLHGTGTFELEPPSVADMRQRRQEVLQRGWPWLVASDAQGQVRGFAYANWFRPRLAYRFCVEDSVYIHPEAQGQGLGRALLSALITRCEAAGARQMVALIGDSANAASIGLHRALGFEPLGVMHGAGWKFDAWRDVVFLQKALGDGPHTPP